MKSLRFTTAALVLCSAFAAAQTAAPAKTPGAQAKQPAVSAAPNKVQPPKPATGTGVNSDEPVIIIDAPCPAPKVGAPKPNCKLTITAAEFRRMAAAVSPNMAPAAQRSFATNLGRMLAYSNEASRLGLQNSPDGKALMELARMQALAQMLGRKVREEAENISPGDLQTYYHENKAKFDTYTLERILIPPKKAAGAEPDKKAEADYAAQLRARWVAGEDPEKLQKEAFERSGNTVTPPPVKIGERAPKSLPTAQEKVFELKPGEITEPISDPSAMVLLKLVNKQTKPFEQVQDDIKTILKNQRMEALVKDLDKRTPAKINDSFFAAQAEPNTAPPTPRTPSVPPAPAKEPK